MMRDAKNYQLTLWLAQRPVFCCGCWCLKPRDVKRAKRVFRLVRAVIAAWEEEARTAPLDRAPF